MKSSKNGKKMKNFGLWVKINNVHEDRKKNSSRLYNIGENLATAELIMDRCKAKLKQMEAKCRLNWSKKKIGGKKSTIPQIDAKVVSDSKVMKAESDYFEAKYFFNVCKTAIVAIKEKGQQLTNITNSKNAELKLSYVPQEKQRDDSIKKKFKKKKKK